MVGHFTLGDQLFFAFTDGLIDTDNPKGQPFGTRRLINFIRSHRTLSPARIATELRKHLREFSGGTPQVDDLTFLIIKK